MSNSCLTCRFADWRKTINGRLHPSGGGQCTWELTQVQLPKAMRWFRQPMTTGDYIFRRKPFEDWPQYQEIER